MSEEKKRIIEEYKDYIQYAYDHSDDYVNWNWIATLKGIVKQLEEEDE